MPWCEMLFVRLCVSTVPKSTLHPDWTLPFLQVAGRLQADVNWGLSEGEVARRRKSHGYNEFEIKQDDPLWKKYLMQVGYSIPSPLAYI